MVAEHTRGLYEEVIPNISPAFMGYSEHIPVYLFMSPKQPR